MSEMKKALILIGSPRTDKSVSDTVSVYLQEKLADHGMDVEKAFIARLMKSEKGQKELLEAVDGSDVIIMVSPLYIDALPALTVRSFEMIHANRASTKGKKPLMMAIINSGFPEPYHNNMAVQICRMFATSSNIEWAGGLCIGMGGALEGKRIDPKNSMMRRLCKGLDSAMAALAKGEHVPQEALDIASKPFMPLIISRLMYAYMGKSIWASKLAPEAKKRLYDRPYKT